MKPASCRLRSLILGVALGLTSAFAAAQPPTGAGAAVSPYTPEQAKLGEGVYRQRCMNCHGPGLENGALAPPLKGPNFLAHWGGRPLDALMDRVTTTMPPGGANSMDPELYRQVVAFMLQQNGVAAGTQAMPDDPAVQARIILPGKAATAQAPAQSELPLKAASPEQAVAASPLLDRLSPVTDAVLAAPPKGDWLLWRRTYAELGDSPLAQINTGNVKGLRALWTTTLAGGEMEGTPLVHDGVLFMQSGGGTFQAYDAATGDLLWQYIRSVPRSSRGRENNEPKARNMAIYGDLLFATTPDAHLLALDARTGKPAWDRDLDDAGNTWRLTGGPIVAKGKVLQGLVKWHDWHQTGGGAVLGLDARTGKTVWRFNTIAHTGEPGGDTWNGVPDDKRSGASVWMAGSYDPKLNLAYFGVAGSYDTGPLMAQPDKPPLNNDGLYTDSTIALDPDTGKLVWHYQHLANDQWDTDWAFEQMIVGLTRGGGVERNYVVTGGKMGIYDAVDAASGKYAFSYDAGLQNVVSSIDPVTGEKRVNPEAWLKNDGKTRVICAYAKNWPAGATDPHSKILYATLNDFCLDWAPAASADAAFLTSGVAIKKMRPRPGSDGKIGMLVAYDLQHHKVVWTDHSRTPRASPLLVTAGGLLFEASADRWFHAIDARTGAVLWQTRLNDLPSGFPITYEVAGRQYVAIPVGGSGHVRGTMSLTPEIRAPYPEGPTLWVFALS